MRIKVLFIICTVALFSLLASCKWIGTGNVSSYTGESIPSYNDKQQSDIHATHSTTTESSSIEQSTTATVTPGRTTASKHPSQRYWRFQSLEEYKDKLATFNSDDAFYLNPSDAINHFTMLLVDRYFLVPIVPSTGTLSGVQFSATGASEFKITLSNGQKIHFTCRHNKKAPGEIENATRTVITNSRGISVAHDHIYSSVQDVHYGFYTWQEGEYYCRMAYEGNDIALYDAFVKELSFEKISIGA